MELISEYLAQWDWYAKRMEEAKIPILEKWKEMTPMRLKLCSPWNFRPEAPREANSSSHENVIVEIWHLEEDTMTLHCRYGIIDVDEWKDPNGITEFADFRAPIAGKWRKPLPYGEFHCVRPLLWFGVGDSRKHISTGTNYWNGRRYGLVDQAIKR
jgi:hypothetical protein